MLSKVGIGYDIHRLVDDRKLIIGGIEIPYVKGLLGHSDADVLTHAICDAVLGAIGEGDIGEIFPDTDPKYENISSLELLKEVAQLAKIRNYRISNIDTVVIAEQPKLTPFKKLIQEKIASVLGVGIDCVNIKAKTNEGLGELGKKEAIASYAVVMLEKI
jgi:2-C-methyl-D-erythritol 2,4-cyclodiphosphate synthase